jgi:3-hydroxyisobutyrate dehydrogenase-like beta-hydroxyacid dehydrogenase
VAGQVLTGRFASRFTIGQYLKDLRIALGLAADHDVPAPVNSTACSVWTSHAARGAAGDDHTRLVDLVLRDAGLEMRWGEN